MSGNDVLNIIKEARRRDIVLFLEGGKLKYRTAGKKNIDRGFIDALVKYKDEIRNLLNTDLTGYADVDWDEIIAERKETERAPLSYNQERLWFIDQLEGSVHYHIPWVMRLKGSLDAAALSFAFSEIVNRHEVLRTVLREEGGVSYQQVMPPGRWQLERVEAGAQPLNELVASLLEKPFDLSTDHMLRVHLIGVAEQEYILLVNIHHIAADGWSWGILMGELTKLYNAYVQDQPVLLPPLPVQYADYACWQRKHLQGAVLEEKLDYWRKQLEGVPVLELPVDYARPAVQSTRGSNAYLHLKDTLATGLRELSMQSGATLFMTLLSAFKVLLYRYTGQEDICVGTPIAGRTQQETEELIGFFANTLALRTQLGGNPSFRELLEKVKATTLESYEHQDVPFAKIVESVVTERDLGTTPLFQVMFVLQNSRSGGETTLAGVSINYESLTNVRSKFDLTVTPIESATGIDLYVEYCADLFKASTIEAMMQHYLHLLEAVVAHPEKTISELRMLTASDERALDSFNETKVDYPANKTLVDLIAEQAAATPGNTAVVFKNQSLSYQQLDERSNQLAHYLRSRGVKEDSLVAICIDRSLEMIIGIVGILKAGAAYVPIDPEYPAERISYMLEDTAAEVVLTSTDWPDTSNEPTTPPATALQPHHLAYVIYTSGSTGKPKGVMNQHNGLVNRLLWMQHQFKLSASDSVLQKTTFCFDVSVWELLWPLITGARLVFAEPGGHRNTAYLKQLIAGEHITTLHFVPSMLEVFLHDVEQDELAGVKNVMCSGEELKPHQANLFTEKLPHAALHNLYGPTEAAIDVTCWTMPQGQQVSVVPIGKPVSNTKIFILDKAGQPVPIGVSGELHIGGIQVARGYLNRAELTAEKFISRNGERLYKTGDLARWLPNGNIQYLGRIDDQVKIRGYRIEPGEIASVVQQSGLVRQNVVIAKNNKLIGYAVADDDFNKEALIAYLEKQLPEYMVPKIWVKLDAIPITSNGKLDRKSLPDADASELAKNAYAAPRNELETTLVKLWQDLLAIDRIGIHDSFFSLGGHSLLATRLVSAVRKTIGVKIPIKHIFVYPTVAALAGRIEELLAEEKEKENIDWSAIIAQRINSGRIPLSYSQERLWFIDQLEGSTHYHIPWVMKLMGDLNINALAASFAEIVNRHQVLRTVLRQQNGISYQHIMEPGQWQMQIIEPGEYALNELIAKPFDLSSDYMLRVHLIRLAEHEHMLLVNVHHVAADGWSWGILMHELTTLYNAHCKGQPVSLPPLAIQYADYAFWQRQHLQGAVLEQKLDYWRRQLKDVPVLELPTDFVRPAIQSTKGSNAYLHLEAALTTGLHNLSNNAGATLFMTLLAAFKVLLHRYTGQQDICVGSPIAGRTQQETEGLIGFFVNTLALRTNLSGNPTFRALLEKVKATTLESYEHQDVPFEKIVESVVTERDLSTSPLFQVMFVLQNIRHSSEAGLDGVTLTYEPAAHTHSKFDLGFTIVEGEKDIDLYVEYCTDLFTVATVERMMHHFRTLLTAIVAEPGKAIGELKLLTAQEEEALLTGFDSTNRFAWDKTINELFAREQEGDVPVAKLLPNARPFILDANRQLAPIGVPGELYLGSEGEIPVHQQNPGLTTDRFTSWGPFTMYRTGELARWLPGGKIECLGKTGEQVKIRGYRIEPAEIAAMAAQSGWVNQCLVIAKKDNTGNYRLVGYVVAADNFSKEKLVNYLKKQLPEYMVPTHWVKLDAMPLDSNGKPDKQALPQVNATELAGNGYVAQRNAMETTLAGIWHELLGIERIGVYDSFFSLGGHSLLATRMVSAIRKTLGVTLPIKHIFVYPTIASLAEYIKELLAEEGHVEDAVDWDAIVQERRNSHYVPLSYSQERLWFIHQLEGSRHYHIPWLVRLKGKLNIQALVAAFTTIIHRHEVLRTVLREEEGLSYQQLLEPGNWQMEMLEAAESSVQPLIASLVEKPFDLSSDYMMRVHLIPLQQQEHLLLINVHHVATDGWSIGILTAELTGLYNRFVQGEEAALPPLPVQYADYAFWQRKHLQGAVLEEKLDYWRKQLKEVPVLKLPADYTRPAIQSTRGSSAYLRIEEKLAASLHDLSWEANATMFMTLLAAFKVLLYRYSGQQDICVGSPIAGRTQQETEGLIGFFINTLALRTDLSGNPPFNHLLEKVKATTLESYEHQDVPFEKIVESVVTERDLSTSPLFQVMFVLQNMQETGALALQGIDAHFEDVERNSAKFDLGFTLVERAGGIDVYVEYCTDLFKPATIERMMRHYRQLLTSAAQDPTQRISELKMMPPHEEAQVLNMSAGAKVAVPKQKTVVDLFAEQVQQAPHKTALVFNEQLFSYKELDERSNQLAHYLVAKGIRPGSNIGLSATRGPGMIICMLGILKAGCAYVPFHTSYPQERLNSMIEDAGISHVVNAGEELFGSLPLLTHSPLIAIDPAACAYILYTSGTTGRPKGIGITHQNIVNLIYGAPEPGINANDKVLQWSNYSFDPSVLEVFGALLKGASLHLVEEAVAADPELLSKVMEEQGITVGIFATAFVNAFIDLAPSGLSALRKIVLGGELASPAHLMKALSLLGPGKILHAYGPTETTVYTTCYLVDEVEEKAAVPIGKPLPNTSAFILDANLQLVPVGVPGELCIGGDGVSPGYVNRPELNAEKFLRWGSAIIYRTGDLARWLPDGNIEFLGRIDEQVKIRGYRVEPGEIASVAQQSGLVKQTAVAVKKDKTGNARLIGYVVADDFNRQALMNYLKQHLPEYMVPNLWVKLDAIPLTGNGKLDTKSLPDADASELAVNTYVAPQTALETMLAGTWQQLLSAGRVGIHDNFFSLGGHSLLATRLVSFIRKETGVTIPIRSVFVYPTIALLAEHIHELQRGQHAKETIDWDAIIAQRINSGRIPLSYSQERLWFIDQLEGSTHYHIPWVMKLMGDLNINALAASFAEIVNRHQVLRTVLRQQNGISYQHIMEPGQWQMQIIELGNYALNELIAKPFDLSSDYMLRVHLIRLAEHEHMLLVNVHHVAADGWSWGILMGELATLYNAHCKGQPLSLPPLAIQYADYAFWQRQHLQGAVLEQKLDYWRRQLKDVPVLELPTDFVRPAIQSTKGSNAYLHLEAALTTGLHNLSKNAGATLFMTLLAAFKVLLHRYTGQQDICVGSPIAGRTQQETESLIGFFVNTLALRTNLSGNPSFRALLEKVKATTLESYEHQDVPFEKIVESVVTERDLSAKPLFHVMFALQNIQESGTPELEGISTRFENHGSKRSKFDITFTLAEREKGIDLYVEYCTDLFKPATIDRMMQHYLRLLTSAITNPAQNIGQLSMLLPSEEEKILNEFNNTAGDYPKNKTIVDLFIQQAKQTPTNTAIVFENQQLTYQQLDDRSSQLAHYIRQGGVTTESPVAICFDRSQEMMIAIVAILKAGGAYVPIDPGYPLERISYMLEDTGAVTVITNLEWMNVIPASYMGRLIAMDAEWAKISKEPTTCPAVEIKPGNLAYIIYTSGSTGKPKGVMVEHRNVVSLVRGVGYVSLSAADVLLATGSPSFDATTFEYWSMLLHGGKLVLCKEAQLLDSQLLKEQVARHAVTKMWFTTGWLNQLIDTDISIFANLSTVITGGEKASEHHLARLHATYPALEIINGYGPTENTTFSLSCKVTSGHLQKALPVGRPLENRTAYVLDKHNHLCPVGVVGEICVGGDGLARGYLNKPELTSEKFISNPVGKEAGSRLYRTGDLGRWLPDGNIEFLGRIDNQVKIRGYRIEPDEISTAVQQSGFVRQSVVVARQDKSGNHRLIGYVVAGEEFSKESLVSYLKKQLPDYMVPTIWIELPSIPLNANGKVDKAALPDVDEADLAAGAYAAPRTALEATLAGIWQEALGVERVGINDNFFAIGGHSLLLIEVITRAKEQNCHLQFEDLFEHQTIAELSAHLGSANGVTQIETGHPNIKLLNQGSAVLPLFLLPGSPGFCDGYEELTGALADQYKIYGLQMTGLREGEEPLHSIQAIAGQCLQWIQQIQPAGPYRFIGHSLGASVAFDMARLLEEKGGQVEFICILDKPVHFTMTTEFKDAMLVKSLVELLRNTEHITGATPAWIMQLESILAECPAAEKVSFIMNFVRQNLGWAKNTGFVLRILYALLIQTDMDHNPHGKVNANMLLVKAAEENWPCSEYLGWEGHAQNIQLINAPGDHRTMVRSHHAITLAAQIKKSIRAIKQF